MDDFVGERWGIPRSGQQWAAEAELLGEGSFSRVYRGWDKLTRLPVAIKELKLVGGGEAGSSFIKEAMDYKMFNQHPNIVSVLAVVENESRTRKCMVLEYCDQGTVASLVEERWVQGKKFTFEQVSQMCSDVLNGLLQIHAVGCCHLDIKPENIGIKSENNRLVFKLLDLGLLSEQAASTDYQGTKGYMAPEMYGYQDVILPHNAKMDIFSFGCVLYELLYFENLFDSVVDNFLIGDEKTIMNDFYKKVKERRYRRNSPHKALDELLGRCLEIDPGRRPDASQILKGLNLEIVQVYLQVTQEFTCSQLNKLDYIDGLPLEGCEGAPERQQLKEEIWSNLERVEKMDMFNSEYYPGSLLGKEARVLAGSEGPICRYGQFNAQTGLFEGFVCEYDAGAREVYFGLFIAGRREGHGLVLYCGEHSADAKEFFVGKFRGGSLIDGILTYRLSKRRYVGEFSNNRPGGKGQMVLYKAGSFYRFSGNYSCDRQLGSLLVRNADHGEFQYLGDFTGCDFEQFRGKMTDLRTKDEFVGTWESLTDGQGQIINKFLESSYEGVWRNLKREGPQSVWKTPDFTYRGGMKNGKFWGRGRLVIEAVSSRSSTSLKSGESPGPSSKPSKRDIFEYEGDWEDGLQHGSGVKKWFDETRAPTKVYEGSFADGLMHGKGKLQEFGKYVYEGDFVFDVKEGNGLMTFLNGGALLNFEGRFERNRRVRGKLQYANYGLYEGEFNEGEAREGYGSYRPGSGETDMYDGYWRADRFDGQGELVTAQGETYEGQFVAGVKRGRGKLTRTSENGKEVINGFFEEAVCTKGIIQFPDGTIYKGELLSNQRHGFGSYQSANGSKYVGEFKDNQYHGKGLITYSNGDRYQGEFSRGKRNGYGELTSKHFRYIGMFKDDGMHGKGVMVHSESQEGEKRFKQEGEFNEGKLEGEGCTVWFKDETRFRGKFVQGAILKGEAVYRDKTRYQGWFKEFRPHDQGQIWLGNGDGYRGSFFEGQMKGRGEYSFGARNEELLVFKGLICDGRKAVGTLTYRTKAGEAEESYFGELLDWEPHTEGESVGVWHKEGVFRYEGKFVHGKLHGECEYMKYNMGNKSPMVFRGMYVNGSQEGEGTCLMSNGDQYKGHFKKTVITEGRFVELATLNVYEGEFVEGQLHGSLGVCWFRGADPGSLSLLPESRIGKKYLGEFRHGRMTGKGTIEYLDRRQTYTGEVVKGRRHGQGKLYYKQSQSFVVGTFLDDEFAREAEHEYHFPEDNKEYVKYVGGYEGDKFNRQGRLFRKDGMVEEGLFVNGVRNGAFRVLQALGGKLCSEGCYKEDLRHGKWTLYEEKTPRVVYYNKGKEYKPGFFGQLFA